MMQLQHKQMMIYFAKNPIRFSVQMGIMNTRLQAYILTKNSAGEYLVKLNPDAPLISDNSDSGYIFELDNVLADHPVFDDNALPGNLPFWEVENLLLPVRVNSAFVGSTDFRQSEDLWILNGRLRSDLFAQRGHFFFSIGDFLTTVPKTKKISMSTKEYIYYLADQNTEAALQVTILYSDFTTQIFNLQEFSLENRKIYGFDISPELIEKHSFFEKTIHNYFVSIVDHSGEKLSKTMSYWIDDVVTESEYQFLFRNQFGVFETVRFTGERTQSLDNSAMSFETRDSMIDYYSENFCKVVFRTGELGTGMMQYLVSELIPSKEVYWLVDGQKIRLNSLVKTVNTFDPTKLVDNLELEYRFALTNRY